MFTDWFWRLIHNLKLLDLSHNNFKELTRADMQFLGSNLTVDLRHNHISVIDLMDSPGLPPHPPNSNTMLLDDNPFNCDCNLYTFVQRLEGLKPVTAEPRFDVGRARCASPALLAGRQLSTLPSAALTCPLRAQDCPDTCSCQMRPSTRAVELYCLEQPSSYPDPASFHFTLYQTHLQLRHVISSDILVPPHVTLLNLTDVGLKEFTFSHLEHVKVLDLSRNNLTTVPLDLLTSNMTLYLSGNPFACDCRHREEVLAIQKHGRKIADKDDVTCDTGDSIWIVDATRLCDVRRAVLLGGTLAAMGIIAALLAALTYRYMLEIKLFLFSRGWCRSLINEDEIDKGAEYDAFVSFSQEDAKWVSEKLVPILEGVHNFKLCVHYRDWVIGDMIPAQIARSVEQSRRTIIVLSKNFLKSTWAALEFRAANSRAQQERRARVLVIVLEDVPEDDDMDTELKAYLTTNTYLKWGDPWFWEKLRYAMPHKRSGLSEVYANSDLKLNRGLNAKLNSDGKIVNDTTLSSLNTY